MNPPATEPLADVIARALDALDALGLLSEDIEDEWTYVTDLADAQRARFEEIRDRRSGDEVMADRASAVTAAIEEAGRIADPHKAIDWLSTFPHLVAMALDGDVDAPADAGPGSGAPGSEPDPDDDSPFRILRGGR